MKSTGIVRRIDDLGRIVIPKEIRETHDIHAGDPLELLIDGDAIIFKKYYPEPTYGDLKTALAAASKDAGKNSEYYLERRK